MRSGGLLLPSKKNLGPDASGCYRIAVADNGAPR